MRILILGAAGMLGHKLLQTLAPHFEMAGTVQDERSNYATLPVVKESRLLPRIRAQDIGSIVAALDAFDPAAVINCIGVVKQLKAARDPIASIGINALFPHQLAQLCEARRARLIHFSTDCVFSGRQGPYTEADISDAEDMYGRTKYLGEVTSVGGCLTLRTSTIGHELRRHTGLIDWFLGQRGGRVNGFARALYSGVTTRVLAKLTGEILMHHPDLDGLWQVAGTPISKYDLLSLVNEVYGLGVRIDRDEEFHCDRRLDGSRFRSETGLAIPDWKKMVTAMAEERPIYEAVPASC